MRRLQRRTSLSLPKTHVLSIALMKPLSAVREQLGKGHISSREERIGMKEKIVFAVPGHKVTAQQCMAQSQDGSLVREWCQSSTGPW